MLRATLVAAAVTACAFAATPSLHIEHPIFSTGGQNHYEDPYVVSECLSGEVNVTIQGITGAFCSPQCSFFKPCPTDLPSGCTATPACELEDQQSGKKFCALSCTPGAPNQCGQFASCKSISSTGICTYDQ